LKIKNHARAKIPKHGYFWVHPECFERYEAVVSNLKAIEKYLKGEIPRITKNGNKLGRDAVEQFLDMYDFDRKWRNTRKLIKTSRDGTPISQVEFEQSPSALSGLTNKEDS